MSTLTVELIPAMSDNYIYLVRDTRSDAVGVVDPGVAEPVIERLEVAGLKPTHVFITHHHADHIGGMSAILDKYGAHAIGPKADAGRIPGLAETVVEGDRVIFGTHSAQVFETPGHTSGHIAFWFEEGEALFSGDTLFALGCGRLFEGTAADMWRSLSKLRALPAATRIFCGHEYTLTNARFALTVDPANAALAERAAEIERQRAAGTPTIPSTLGVEVATNPFLRADDAEVQAHLAMVGRDPAEVFAEIRGRKDNA